MCVCVCIKMFATAMKFVRLPSKIEPSFSPTSFHISNETKLWWPGITILLAKFFDSIVRILRQIINHNFWLSSNWLACFVTGYKVVADFLAFLINVIKIEKLHKIIMKTKTKVTQFHVWIYYWLNVLNIRMLEINSVLCVCLQSIRSHFVLNTSQNHSDIGNNWLEFDFLLHFILCVRNVICSF